MIRGAGEPEKLGLLAHMEDLECRSSCHKRQLEMFMPWPLSTVTHDARVNDGGGRVKELHKDKIL